MSRKLDAWIGKHVMGIDVQKDKITRGFFAHKSETDPLDYFVGDSNDRIPAYSTDIEAAWDVVEVLKGDDRIEIFYDSIWFVDIRDNDMWRSEDTLTARGQDEELPMAICMAVYKLKTELDWEGESE